MDEIERLRLDNQHLMEQVKELEPYKADYFAALVRIYNLEHRLGQNGMRKIMNDWRIKR